ncbi:MAG: hypothetical protein LWW86_04825 [Micrococcales bacterium]|nr:hypothetical protein [Micrococcales bacterium]
MTGTAGQTQTLTRSQVFDPGQWEEGSYSSAVTGKEAPALAVSVPCTSYEEQALELRVSQAEGELTADVAQALDSPSSSSELQFSLHADGRQVDVAKIRFKERATLKTDLAGVGAVVLSVKQVVDEKTPCREEATALITSLQIAE